MRRYQDVRDTHMQSRAVRRSSARHRQDWSRQVSNMRVILKFDRRLGADVSQGQGVATAARLKKEQLRHGGQGR